MTRAIRMKMQAKTRLLLALSCIFVLAVGAISCGGRAYKRLSDKQMQALMSDLYRADALFTTVTTDEIADSQRLAIYNDIFSKHQISSADYDSNLAWYSSKRLKRYIVILERLESEFQNQERLLLNEQHYQSRLPGAERDPEYYMLDSVNLLSADTTLFFLPGSRRILIPHTIIPPYNYTAGTRFGLHCRVNGLQLAPDASFTMYLRLHLGDSVAYIEEKRLIQNSGSHQIEMEIPEPHRVKAVNVSFDLLPKNGSITLLSPLSIDSISLVQTSPVSNS